MVIYLNAQKLSLSSWFQVALRTWREVPGRGHVLWFDWWRWCSHWTSWASDSQLLLSHTKYDWKRVYWGCILTLFVLNILSFSMTFFRQSGICLNFMNWFFCFRRCELLEFWWSSGRTGACFWAFFSFYCNFIISEK